MVIEKVLIKDLKPFSEVNSVYSVKYKHPVKEYKNGFMFTVGIADKSGESEVIYFGGKDKGKVEAVYDSFKTNELISVKGFVKTFKGKTKINVNEEGGLIRLAKEDEYDLKDFMHFSNQDLEKLFSYVSEKIEKVENPFIKKLLKSFFEDTEFLKKFRKSPAAMYMHHACIGGLLEHTWGILKICETCKEVHPSLDEDLIVAGALLHDIGKIQEFKVTSNIKQSEKGMLLGHVGIGFDIVSKKIDEIEGFPEVLKNKILHMMISHHGEKEYGALVKPTFPEAATLHYADYLDSQITQYIRKKKDVETEDFRTYDKRLGSIYLK